MRVVRGVWVGKWALQKKSQVILRPQTPLSYPSKKKTASDVTAETAQKNAVNFEIRPLYFTVRAFWVGSFALDKYVRTFPIHTFSR